MEAQNHLNLWGLFSNEKEQNIRVLLPDELWKPQTQVGRHYTLCIQLRPTTLSDLQNKQDMYRDLESRGESLLCSIWYYARHWVMWSLLSNKRASCISVIQNQRPFLLEASGKSFKKKHCFFSVKRAFRLEEKALCLSLFRTPSKLKYVLFPSEIHVSGA